MTDNKELKVLNSRPQDARGVDRRQALQALLAGGAGIAVPGLAELHPVHRHLSDSARIAEAGAAAATPEWKPEFLDTHQVETLIVLAERIVPGSTRANVARFVDRLLSVDTQENQTRFLGSMGALAAASINRFGRPWKALTEAEQVELLTAASSEAPGEKDASGKPSRRTLRDHFDNLKGWVVGAYYSSEIGMRELGWTGNMFFASFPGCTHPDGHR